MLSGLLVCAIVAITLCTMLWGTYNHHFTFTIKWQDMLMALLGFITFTACGGCIFVVRFLYALHGGYHKSMILLVGDSSLAVRDLSAENLASIFWIMNSAFWCFVAGLVGLSPLVLISWTVSLPNLVLAVLATGIVILLSIAGLVVSLIAFSFVLIGCVGSISFGRKLGALQTYKLDNHTILRRDGSVLAVIYPDMPESMIDLKLLDLEDQRKLLALLHEHRVEVRRVWNPDLSEESAVALEEAEPSMVVA